MTNEQILAYAVKVDICSGEGSGPGVIEAAGIKTIRSLVNRLARERCAGQRWAHALITMRTGEVMRTDAGRIFFQVA